MAYYSMQTARLPRKVCDDIDKRTRRFVWGGTEEKKRIHLLSWEVLQKPKNEGGLGIRSSRQANAAFLTKLGWRIMAEPNALWSRVVRQKYCKGRCDVDMFTPTTNMSNIWKGVTDNAHILRKGIASAVGNGHRTLFWDHLWATDLPLRSLCINQIPEDIDGATVSDMWEHGQGWKWHLLQNLFSNDSLNLIAAHELTNDPTLEDMYYWKGNCKGGFSIKHAIKLIRNDNNNEYNKQWEVVWRIPVQQRIRTFLWLILHDRVLCNLNKVKRHLSDNPSCPRCNTDEESLLHLLRDCVSSRMIWQQVDGTPSSANFFQGELHQWINWNLAADGEYFSDNWPTTFAITLWWIWKWRNSMVFGNSNEIPMDIRSFLQIKFEEQIKVFYSNKEDANLTSSQRQERHIKWTFPPLGWHVLNTDGASKGSPGAAGGGGVLRDEQGKFIKAFAANYGNCNSSKAEFKAVLQGIKMARSMHITKLVIQMDNAACIQALQRSDYHGGECYNIIKQCKQLLDCPNWDVDLTHCYREANRVADWLANHGVMLTSPIIFFNNVPHSLASLLHDDAVGVALPRMIVA